MKKILFILATLLFAVPVFSQWDGTSSPWSQGTGTQSDPYQISSPHHLAFLADMVTSGVNDYEGKYFLLTQDISLSNQSWMPIGDEEHAFKGYFDGGGHTIDSMRVNNTYVTAGLFGYVSYSSIHDCILRGSYSTTINCTYAGGFVGKCTNNCTFYNLTNYCNVRGNAYMGGIVGRAGGYAADSTQTIIISNCFNYGLIELSANGSAAIRSVGGVIGLAACKLVISGCSNHGSINVIANTSMTIRAGGICGYLENIGSCLCLIVCCYNTALIYVNNQFSGSHYRIASGIINANDLNSSYTIKYCYNTGNIHLVGGSNRIASGICNGICPYSCYNVGTIIMSSNAYGICSSGCENTNSYYKEGCGATIGGYSRTEAQMKSVSFPIILNADSTVFAFDQENINDGYPIFIVPPHNVHSDSSSNITTFSSQVHGSYDGVADTVGFLYGDYNGIVPMSLIISENQHSPISHTLTGLQPNTQYRYAFFVKYNGNYFYGDTLTFTTKPICNVIVSSNNSSWGSVSGGGTYGYGQNAILTATAAEHYQFKQWQDGNTDNPRLVTVTGNCTYTAEFETAQYTITALTNNSSWGSVVGAGVYAYNTPFLLTAIPVEGHHFEYWLEESSHTFYFEEYNPMSFTATRNETYTAYFAVDQHSVNVLSNNDTMGYVTGGGVYNYGQQIYIMAHPYGNYIFTQWSDGDTQPSRLITVTEDVTYTAIFTDAIFNITGLSNNVAFGSVSGSGGYARGSQVLLTAIPNAGYHFTQWSDGNTDNPRTITVNADATYTAQFAANTYVVNVNSNNTLMGSATGGGIFSYGQQAAIEATALPHYRFVQWSDGNNGNPRVVTITSDTTFTAMFEQMPQYTITVVSADETKGSVSGGGTFYGGETTVINAIAASGNVFDRWSDGNTEAIRTITVTSDATYTAYFSGVRYTVNVYSNDDQMGNVSGGGEYEQGTQATVTATPSNGCRFVRWNNGVETNPYTFTVYSDVNIIANFERSAGLEDVENFPYTVASGATSIVINGAENRNVCVRDVLGRTVFASAKYDGGWVELRSAGVYFVSVDGNRTKKIVLINK